MKATKRGKNVGSAGTSPSKDTSVNRPGAITPAKSSTMNTGNPNGIFAFKPKHQGGSNDISNAGSAMFHDETKNNDAVQVDIKDVIDEAASKAQIYRALTIYGKFV